MLYESLLNEFESEYVISERAMPDSFGGLNGNNVIWINARLNEVEKACILAEEIGHAKTTVGNILDLTKPKNRKQELKARRWAHKKIIPLQRLVNAHNEGVKTKHELVEHLNVTEEFLTEALEWYQNEYGICKSYGGYNITFDPLNIKKEGKR